MSERTLRLAFRAALAAPQGLAQSMPVQVGQPALERPAPEVREVREARPIALDQAALQRCRDNRNI
jgi:hypothetical protein